MCTPWQQNHVLYIQLYNMHLLLVTKHLYPAAATICILFYLMPDLPIWPAINAIFVREIDSEEYCTQIKQDFYGFVVFIERLCFLHINIINICIKFVKTDDWTRYVAGIVKILENTEKVQTFSQQFKLSWPSG